MLVRLQKIIAQAGVASRRKAEELIREGQVTVNGRAVRELGAKADPERDHIRVGGKLLKGPEPPLYFLLHKPRNVLTTVRDEEGKGRPTVLQFLRAVRGRVFPVGRLDFDAEGLVFLTNDGALAQVLMHPRYGVPRRYEVKVKGVPEAAALERLGKGRGEGKGSPPAPAGVELARVAEKNAWLRVTLREGQTHQIKRMFEAVGHPALRIRRVGFGPLSLRGLPPGSFRRLEEREVAALRDLAERAKGGPAR